MEESKLLNIACNDRNAFLVLSKYGFSDNLAESSKFIWKAVARYYEKDKKASYVDLEVIRDLIKRKFENTIHEDKLNAVLNNFREGVSVPNVLEAYTEYKLRELEEQIQVLIAQNNDKKAEAINEWIELKRGLNGKEYGKELHQGVEFEEEELSNFNPYMLYPKSLNKYIDGGMEKQEQAIVFARPNLGKTALALTFAVGFLKQGLKVLFLTNEDSPRKTKLRLAQVLLGVSKEKILNEPQEAARAVKEKGGDRFYFKELDGGGTLEEIEEQILKCEPDVVLLDMMRHINVKGNSKHEKLEEIARVMRGYCEKHNFISILFSQAGDSATGKQYISINDFDESNTGVQGACDIMIGVGASDSQLAYEIRTVSFCKNKRGMDNSHCEIKFDRKTSRFI